MADKTIRLTTRFINRCTTETYLLWQQPNFYPSLRQQPSFLTLFRALTWSELFEFSAVRYHATNY
jgi:hypothetical protein